MKQALFVWLLLVAFTTTTLAQAPQRFGYQAVIRNSSNALVSNKAVAVKISLAKDSATGTVVYSEVHQTTTNANGLVTLQVGGGQATQGNFSTINWGSGNYYITTQTDPDGGSNYTISGTTQLLSVPYALYAENGYSLEFPDGFANAITKIIKPLESYTIPEGKNFYTLGDIYAPLKIGNDTFAVYDGWGYRIPRLIIGSGKTVNSLILSSYASASDSIIVVHGFLADKSVTAVNFNLNEGDFIVPAGKIFVLFGLDKILHSYPGDQNYTPYILANKIDIRPSSSNWPSTPLLFSGGTVLSGKVTINGYLK